MQALAVMDNLGYLNVILFKKGEFNTPVAVIPSSEWESMNTEINKQLKTLYGYARHVETVNSLKASSEK